MMLPIIILVVSIVIGVIAAVNAILLSEGDQHYQYVAILSLAQASANDYTEVAMDGAGTPTNSGTSNQRESLLPEFAPNAFGKGKHGAAVWDIKEFLVGQTRGNVLEAGQTNLLGWAIVDDGTTRTSLAGEHLPGYVAADEVETKSITGAAGEVFTVQKLRNRYAFPMDIVDGQSSHFLATAAAYRFGIDSTGIAVTNEFRLGMRARRVIIPLIEVYFDRETIAGLLDAVILESILG